MKKTSTLFDPVLSKYITKNSLALNKKFVRDITRMTSRAKSSFRSEFE